MGCAKWAIRSRRPGDAVAGVGAEWWRCASIAAARCAAHFDHRARGGVDRESHCVSSHAHASCVRACGWSAREVLREAVGDVTEREVDAIGVGRGAGRTVGAAREVGHCEG